MRVEELDTERVLDRGQVLELRDDGGAIPRTADRLHRFRLVTLGFLIADDEWKCLPTQDHLRLRHDPTSDPSMRSRSARRPDGTGLAARHKGEFRPCSPLALVTMSGLLAAQ